MTELERDSLTTFIEIRDAWTRRTMKPADFMEMIGRVVRMIKRLEARLGGCPTGNHFGRCYCLPAVIGHAHDWRDRQKKEAHREAKNS